MISHEMKDQTLWIAIADSLTVDDFEALQAAQKEQGYEQIIIDFSQTKHIDSGGLGILLQLRTQMADNGDKILLHAASEHILKIFDVVNFDKLFKIT